MAENLNNFKLIENYSRNFINWNATYVYIICSKFVIYYILLKDFPTFRNAKKNCLICIFTTLLEIKQCKTNDKIMDENEARYCTIKISFRSNLSFVLHCFISRRVVKIYIKPFFCISKC